MFSDDAKSCHLIASKTRIAPVNSLSLRRLELCAAVLGVNLLETVHRVLVFLFVDRMSLNGWTDSTIFYRGFQSRIARGKLSFVTAYPNFNQFYHSTIGTMLTVTKTQLIFAPVESLQIKLQTNLCRGMDHPGNPTNCQCHILQLPQLIISQYKQTRLLLRLVKLATFNQV